VLHERTITIAVQILTKAILTGTQHLVCLSQIDFQSTCVGKKTASETPAALLMNCPGGVRTIGIANAPHAGYHLAILIQHLHLLVHWHKSSAVGLSADRLQVQPLRPANVTIFFLEWTWPPFGQMSSPFPLVLMKLKCPKVICTYDLHLFFFCGWDIKWSSAHPSSPCMKQSLCMVNNRASAPLHFCLTVPCVPLHTSRSCCGSIPQGHWAPGGHVVTPMRARCTNMRLPFPFLLDTKAHLL
jgi:hypothetical protein